MVAASPSAPLPLARGGRPGLWWLRRDRWGGRARFLALVASPWLVATIFGVPFCPTALFLHTSCPGCGLTRATWAMLGGDFAGAVALHPLAPLVSPFFVGTFGYLGLRYVIAGRTDMKPWLVTAVGVLSALLVLLWAARLFGAFGGPVPV